MPRAPSHAQGVTLCVEISRISSAGITPPSSLLRTHAPIRNPPHASGNPSYTRSLQVAVSPCWESDLPGVVSANLSSRAWTPTPAALVVLLPVSSHKTTAFPTLGPGRRGRFCDHGKYPYSNFRREPFTRLQSFTNVQAREFARHPDCSYRNVLLFRSPSSLRRVRWVSHRFRFGPQSDSHRPSQLPAAHRAAVASTSPHISVRYLPEQGIC